MEGPGKIKHSRPVPPFLRWCSATIPAVFDDSLTYYEALCSLWKWLQTNLVEVVNNNATVTQEYIQMVDELKEFVDNYFENLDVQEEIDNKLDEMVKDGTFQSIIQPIIQQLTTCRYIFPKLWNTQGSGDATLLISPNKNILFDTHYTDSYLKVKEMLYDNDVDHIDVLVISHYDGDHWANIQNLIIDGYIDSETTAYLGCIPQTYGQTYIDNANQAKAWLDEAGATSVYPKENSTVTIDSDADLKFNFLNCDPDVIDTFEPKYTNNASLIVIATNRNSSAFIGGDAQYVVYDYLYSQGFPKKPVDLYKVSHHGYEWRTNINFVEQLNPKYAVVSMQDLNNVAEFGSCYCEETTILKQQGCEIYACYDQTDYIEFLATGDNIICTKGKSSVLSGKFYTKNIYVDINASKNAPQDGTQEHPFSEVAQAIASIEPSKDCLIEINLADGHYHVPVVNPDVKRLMRFNNGRNIIVRVNGNSEDNTKVILDNVVLHNSTVVFRNLTLNCKRQDGIALEYSDAYLANVNIDTDDSTTSTHHGINAKILSNVYANNVSINNVARCIVLDQGSNFTAIGTVAIKSHTGAVVNKANDCTLLTGSNFTFTSTQDKKDFEFYKLDYVTPTQICDTHSEYAQNLSLVKSLTNFKWIEIFYHTTDGEYGNTGKIYDPNNKSVNLKSYHKDNSDNLILKEAVVTLSGSSANITNSYKMVIPIATGVVTVSTDQGFAIDKIVACRNYDYINLV